MDVTLHETHISWVLLAGRFAYKLKKPVNLGFVDLSTPAKRLADCRTEVQLNQRLCPDVYLDVVHVVKRDGQIAIGGAGTPLEPAVRMRRLPEDGSVGTIEANWRENFEQTAELVSHGCLEASRNDAIREYVERFVDEQRGLLAERSGTQLTTFVCSASERTLRARLAARSSGSAAGASDARVELWPALKAAYSEPSELRDAVRVDTGASAEAAVSQAINALPQSPAPPAGPR